MVLFMVDASQMPTDEDKLLSDYDFHDAKTREGFIGAE